MECKRKGFFFRGVYFKAFFYSLTFSFDKIYLGLISIVTISQQGSCMQKKKKRYKTFMKLSLILIHSDSRREKGVLRVATHE